MMGSPYPFLSNAPSVALVTPESGMRGRKGHCENWSDWSDCGCQKAIYYTHSPSCCGLPIEEGHCIQRSQVYNGPWIHVLCPNATSDRGIVTLKKGLRKVNLGSLRQTLNFDTAPPSESPQSVLLIDGPERNQSTTEDVVSSLLFEPSSIETQCFTDEIINYRAPKGQLVCVNALAGCGKATTIAALCNTIVERDRTAQVLYLVFNAKIQDEAKSSNKFPKDRMEIRTTHAFVLRHYFTPKRMHLVNPCKSHSTENIIMILGLETDSCVQKIREWMDKQDTFEKWEQAVFAVAATIRKTLEAFEASTEKHVMEFHVPWPDHDPNLNALALSERTAWITLIERS